MAPCVARRHSSCPDFPAADCRLDCVTALGADQRLRRIPALGERISTFFRRASARTESHACPRAGLMNLTRRAFLRVSGSSAALLAAAGCDQLPRELRMLYAQPKAGEPFRPPIDADIDPVVHVLNRAAFGPRPGEYEHVMNLARSPEQSANAYLERQLNPETIDDAEAEHAVRRFETLNEPLGELFEYHDELLHNELMRGTLTR